MIRLLVSVVELRNPRSLYIKEACKLHTTIIMRKAEDRKGMMTSLPIKDEGTVGEKSVDIDGLIQK